MMSKLLLFPNELLGNVLGFLEYASEVNAVAQTCTRFHDVANSHLYTYYSKAYSPYGVLRMMNNNDPKALKMLFASGMWLRIPTPFGIRARDGPETPISQAARAGIQILRALLDHLTTYNVLDPIDVTDRKQDRSTSAGYPPFLWSFVVEQVDCGLKDVSDEQYVETMDLLMETPAFKLAKASQLQETLYNAAGRGNLSMVKTLVEDLGVDANYRSDDDTPIGLAAQNGHLGVVEYLLGAGVDIDLHPERSPVTRAAFFGHTQVETFLIDHGVNLGSPENFSHGDLCDLIDMTRFFRFRLPSSIQKMVDLTPFRNSSDPEEKSSALKFAALTGDDTLVSQLLQDRCFEGYRGVRKALHKASRSKSPSVTKALFETLISLKRDPPSGSIKYCSTVNCNDLEGTTDSGWKNISERRRFGEWHQTAAVKLIKYDPKPLLPLFEDYIKNIDISDEEGTVSQVCLDGANSPEICQYLLDRDLGYFSEPDWIVLELYNAFTCYKNGDSSILKFIETILRRTTVKPLDQFKFCLPDTTCSTSSLLQAAASSYSLEGLSKFLEITGWNFLDPSDEVCCQALSTAVEKTCPEIVRYFLDKGFDANRTYHQQVYNPESCLRDITKDCHLLYMAIDSVGTAQFQYSDNPEPEKERYYKVPSVLRELLDHGAEVDAVGPCGGTALALAIRLKNWGACQLLIDRGANPILGFEKGISALQEMMKATVINDELCGNGNSLTFKSTAEALFKSIPHDMAQSQSFLQFIDSYATCKRPSHFCKSKMCNKFYMAGGITARRWSHYFTVKMMRQRYWRSRFPVPGTDV